MGKVRDQQRSHMMTRYVALIPAHALPLLAFADPLGGARLLGAAGTGRAHEPALVWPDVTLRAC